MNGPAATFLEECRVSLALAAVPLFHADFIEPTPGARNSLKSRNLAL